MKIPPHPPPISIIMHSTPWDVFCLFLFYFLLTFFNELSSIGGMTALTNDLSLITVVEILAWGAWWLVEIWQSMGKGSPRVHSSCQLLRPCGGHTRGQEVGQHSGLTLFKLFCAVRAALQPACDADQLKCLRFHALQICLLLNLRYRESCNPL